MTTSDLRRSSSWTAGDRLNLAGLQNESMMEDATNYGNVEIGDATEVGEDEKYRSA